MAPPVDVPRDPWLDAGYRPADWRSHEDWWVHAYACTCVDAVPSLANALKFWRCKRRGRWLYIEMCHRDPRVVATEPARSMRSCT